MKHLSPLFLLSTILALVSCANQGSPSGGPRDTIPPTFTASIPINKSLNYQGQDFSFEFDERINAEQLKTKLNITPFTENKFSVLIKKNFLNLKFEEAFDDSTTYTFNFADGVGDITEKNSVVNFTYAFSTGPIIDSIYVKGNIRDLYNNQVQKEILIAVFAINDTLNLFTGKPRYFTKTDEDGNYIIENIKTGYYKIYCFEDEDNNLKCSPQKEKHGFRADTLELFTSKDSININIQLIDASEPKFVRSKNTGLYFDILYNKYIKEYTLSKINLKSDKRIPKNSFYKNNSTIRFYPESSFINDKDSLQIKVHAFDSLGNTLQDTVYVLFKESRRKPEKFSFTIKPSSNSTIDKLIDFQIDFSKPINKINSDSLLVSYDTIRYQKIPDSLFIWNTRNTKLTFTQTFDRNYIPEHVKSFLDVQQRLDSLAKVNIDTTLSTLTKPQSNRISLPKNQIILTMKSASFISIDGDSTEFIERKYPFLESGSTGKISGLVQTKNQSYFFQLIDKNYKVIHQLESPKKFNFPNVKPGSYSFRVLIDKNNDGIWSSGNILMNIEPEPIWFNPEEHISLKASWEIDLSEPDNLIRF
jgi:uncharacterized protein (DUF2141 family)